VAPTGVTSTPCCRKGQTFAAHLCRILPPSHGQADNTGGAAGRCAIETGGGLSGGRRTHSTAGVPGPGVGPPFRTKFCPAF
jgi:hypothetical protein